MTTSLEFAGNATSYIRVPYNSALDIANNEDFTIEWYQYQTDENAYPRVFQIGAYDTSILLGVSIEIGDFYLWIGSPIYLDTLTDYKNKWVHFAISRNSGIIRVFKDGVQIGENIENSSAIASNVDLVIGNEDIVSEDASYGGYIYGFKWDNGVGKYTTNFAVPTIYEVDNNTILFLTGDQSQGTLGASIVKTNILSSPLIPAGFNQPTPPLTPIEYIQAQRFPVLSNNLIFYKPTALASGGVGTTRNSRIKSRRT